MDVPTRSQNHDNNLLANPVLIWFIVQMLTDFFHSFTGIICV